VEDVAVANIKFASGALGVIEASTATYPGELKRIEVSGNAGSAVLREEDLAVWKFAKENKNDDAIREKMASRTHTGGGAADPKAIGYHGHTLQFQDVLNAVKRGKQPLIDGPEGRRAVELILAIYKSAESGKPVKLPLANDPPLKARAKGKKL
jgi:predicted dehydrogenase